MHDILLIGINHKTAPVELRECIAFDKDESASALETLRRTPVILEALLYSTCNRVELLLVTDDKARAVEAAKEFMSGRNNIPMARFENSLYVHENDHAVRHLFRVAASLDSMRSRKPIAERPRPRPRASSSTA